MAVRRIKSAEYQSRITPWRGSVRLKHVSRKGLGHVAATSVLAHKAATLPRPALSTDRTISYPVVDDGLALLRIVGVLVVQPALPWRAERWVRATPARDVVLLNYHGLN